MGFVKLGTEYGLGYRVRAMWLGFGELGLVKDSGCGF